MTTCPICKMQTLTTNFSTAIRTEDNRLHTIMHSTCDCGFNEYKEIVGSPLKVVQPKEPH